MRPLITFSVLAILVFMTLIIVRAPASLITYALAGQGRGLSFASVEGTLWQGKISGLVVGTVNLGEVAYEMRPLSLLSLSPDLDVRLSGSVAVGTGRVRVSRSRLALNDTDLRVRLDGVTQSRALGVPVTGYIDLDIETMTVRRDGCEEGSLSVESDFLTVPARLWGAEGFVMSGPGRCENNAIFVDLSGEGADGAATLALTMRPDFSFVVDVAVNPGRADVKEALELIGFEPDGQALTYQTSGVLRNFAL